MSWTMSKDYVANKKEKNKRIIGKLIQPPKQENSNYIVYSFVLTKCQYDMPLNNNWLKCLESRKKYHAAKWLKFDGRARNIYKNKVPSSKTDLVLADLFYIVYERPVPSCFFFSWFCGFNIPKIFLSSISSPARCELSSRFLSFTFFLFYTRQQNSML